MLLTVVEQYYFLQALGWGIINSLWQSALLWVLYQCIITADKNLSPLFKLHFSVLLQLMAFTWFAITSIENYYLIKDAGNEAVALAWLQVSEKLAASLQYLSVGYMILLLLHGFKFFKRLLGVYHVKNSPLIKSPVAIRVFTTQTALHIGIRKKVSVWLSQNVDVPCVIGFFKPIILLPVTALNNLTTSQAEAILLHELAHIKRNDYIVNLLQSVVELILFFNPFVSLLGKAARIERENCCDDWVLNYRYNRHEYATALLVLEQNRSQSLQLVMAATNSRKNLLVRIKRLFAAQPQISIGFGNRVKMTMAAGLLVTAIFFILPVVSNQAPAVQFQQHNIADPAPAAAYSSFNYEGIEKKTIRLTDKPNRKVPVIKPPISIAKAAKKKLLPKEKEYTLALVNEELLYPENQSRENAFQVADREETATPVLIVKVEEEQSGVKDKNTYLIELRNNNGTAEIKPLIFLSSKLKTVNKAVSKNKTALPVKPTLKTRITS